MKEVKEVARQNLEKARQKQRESNEEKKQKWRPFAPGDIVYCAHLKNGNWGKWIGLFEIVYRIGADYKIRSSTGKITVAHHD